MSHSWTVNKWTQVCPSQDGIKVGMFDGWGLFIFLELDLLTAPKQASEWTF